MRAVIVEDEKPSRERLKNLLAELGVEVIGEAGDGKDALKAIEKLKPDVVFLDINLPELSGMEVLSKLKFRPKVVFVTAYDQYAVKAFEENAVDYILKPFSKERLKKAIERAKEVNERVLERLEAISKEYMRMFPVKLGNEIFIIPEEDVYYFKAEEKYVFLVTKDKEYFCDFTLKELERRLDPKKFCRVHKSYMVAIEKIKKISPWFSGAHIITLKDDEGTKIKVSRGYYPLLRKKLGL